jgi:tetratricopeptide (TPR) repeat protein
LSEAIVHYERAIDAARRISVEDSELSLLLIALGDARQHAGLFDAALDAYGRAARAARDDSVTRALTHLLRARAHEGAGTYVRALAETTRGARVASSAGGAGDAVRAELLAYAASVRTRQSRSEQARRAGVAAAELALQCGARAALASAYNSLCLAEVQLGHDEAAAEYARQAYELYVELGDLERQATVANNLGIIAYYGNDWDESLRWYGQAAERNHDLGLVLAAALNEANIGEVLVNQGRLEEAEPVLRQAVRVLRASDSAETPFAEMHLGRLLTASGQFEESEQLLRAVVERCREIGSDASAYEAGIHLADCLVVTGRPREALAELSSLTLDRPEEIAIFEAAKCLVEATALVELGQVADAAGVLRRGVGAAREQSLMFDLARLLLLAARTGVPFDQNLDVAAAIEEGRRLLDRLGVVAEPLEALT